MIVEPNETQGESTTYHHKGYTIVLINIYSGSYCRWGFCADHI